MNIALVCDWYAPRLGGIERHLTQLSARLVAAGHDVTVLTPTRGPATDGSGVRVVRLNPWLLPGSGLMWTPRAFRRLGALIRGGGFDAVHVHNSILTPASYAALYHAKKAGIAVVSTEHSLWGGFARVAHRLDQCLHWTGWPVLYSAVSERVAGDMRPVLGARGVELLPNAVDPAEWRVEPRPGGTTMLFAAVMRLVPRKCGAALIRAFSTARAQLGRSCGVRLEIAGDGPDRPRLERLVASRGLTGVVRFHGAVSPAGVKSLLARSDVFVLPTRVEAFGIAALEARAAGLPVVAMRDSGVAEFIAHGREGMLAADEPDLARCLVRLAHESGLRSAIAAHNRATPVAFTWERSIAAHVNAYEKARALCAATACAPRAGHSAPASLAAPEVADSALRQS